MGLILVAHLAGIRRPNYIFHNPLSNHRLWVLVVRALLRITEETLPLALSGFQPGEMSSCVIPHPAQSQKEN